MRQLHTVPNLLFVSKNTTLRKYPNSIICHFLDEIHIQKYLPILAKNIKQSSSKQDFVNNEFVDTN